jgi:histidine triad (HIT) family protein
MIDLLFSIAKTGIGGWLLHRIFAHFSFLIPGEKLIETDTLIAFHHPIPAYPLHILIVPNAKLKNLAALPTKDQQFESDLFQAVNELVGQFDLTQMGYRLIVNGGQNQEIPHLHFHLISESGIQKEDE